jgi:hypothetical protein
LNEPDIAANPLEAAAHTSESPPLPVAASAFSCPVRMKTGGAVLELASDVRRACKLAFAGCLFVLIIADIGE